MTIQKILVFILLLGLTACFEAVDNPRSVSSIDDNLSGEEVDANGNGVTGTDGSVEGSEENPIIKVEIRHLIEPKIDDDGDGGDYKRKLTIPKNYNGLLYLAGINISSLASKSIKVRFNLGTDSLPIEIPATVSTGPGLIPQTNVEVLIMDLRSKPFEDVQLLYDLFDYNEYDFDGTGTNPAALSEPVDFNRNDKLFCRGLSLKDDSTFTGSVADGCNDSDDICKFAYAKVLDKGLIQEGTGGSPDQPIIPDEAQIQSGANGYHNDTNAIKLSRCLATNPLLSANSYTFDLTTSFLTFGSSDIIDGSNYIYEGPYRALNTLSWQITSDAVKGQFGIFSGMLDDSVNVGVIDTTELSSGYDSKLFPLYTKFELTSGVEYLGSNTPDGEKTLFQMNANGESEWIDGCNERVNTVHPVTGEHVGSCNISATIEIIATNDEGVQTVVDITKEVKLQLVKPSALNSQGENVLLSSFRQCSSSSQCGADECCINKHCWGKSLVNQCIEDLPSYGNQPTGESCTTDYQCASLCCNKIDGRCAPHDTIAENPSFCSKPSGQSCVAKEWCGKHPVTTCAIVTTGTDPNGGQTCALRCVTAEVFGECTSPDGIAQGACIPPAQPTSPVFNPNDPNRCDDAITFNQLVECANNPDQACGP